MVSFPHSCSLRTAAFLVGRRVSVYILPPLWKCFCASFENIKKCNLTFVFQNVCQTLWCLVRGFCRSKLDAAADGTRCGEKKVMCQAAEERRAGSGH